MEGSDWASDKNGTHELSGNMLARIKTWRSKADRQRQYDSFTSLDKISGFHTVGQQKGTDTSYREVTVEMRLNLYKTVMHQNLWHTRTRTYIFALVCILFLSEFCFLYPTRKVGDLINIATTINYASRRVYLVHGLSYFTRELILDDGFSRYAKPRVARAIDYLVNELEISDYSVRIGNKDYGIPVGANDHSEFHNDIMYKRGCPWRVNTTNCDIPGQPGVGGSGLLVILRTFIDYIKSSLKLYGPPPDTWPPVWNGGAGNQNDYTNIVVDPDRVRLMQTDTKLSFIMQSFDGDLIQGLSLVTRALQDEAAGILGVAVNENQVLYAVHVLVTVLFFYVILFRRTIFYALAEVGKARKFVVQIPLHLFQTQQEIDLMLKYFRSEENEEEIEETKEDELTVRAAAASVAAPLGGAGPESSMEAVCTEKFMSLVAARNAF